MTSLKYDSGSFRDPAGRVFYFQDEVYREVFQSGLKRLKFIQSDNLLNDLIKNNFFVKTEIIHDENITKLCRQKSTILKHEKINFISYPYEWTFNQLKDAAIFHLELQIYLLSKNAKLIDASAYNIQFKNNKPIFIDVLSVEKYVEGEYWFGHKQFCENFLNPLILKARKGVDFNNWFKGNLEGITTNDLCNLLSWSDFLSFTIFFQVFLQNKMNIKSNKKKIGSEIKIKNLKKLKKTSFLSILRQLKSFIKGLTPKKQFTSWENYSVENTYNSDEEKIKLEITENFYKNNKIRSLVDLGCNNGKFSNYAAMNSVKVVGFDFDINVLDEAYQKAKKNNSNFLPLFSDFTNPSSNLGWNEGERFGLNQRKIFDASISLAVIHHLVIAKNIPISEAIRWLTSFSPKGLIEFVPKTDPTVKTMMALKGDIFPDYNEKNFETLLSSIKLIKNTYKVTNTNRKIYEFCNK